MRKNIVKLMRLVLLVPSFFLLMNISSSSLAISLMTVSLPPGGGPLALPGASLSVEADLAGTVIYDKLIPFTIVHSSGALLFEGTLQNRVVKSNRNGYLHFYYRIRDTKAGLNGVIAQIETQSFQTLPILLVDWRPDGLGTVNPITAQRSSAPGSTIRFNFDSSGPMVLVGGQESKFFFIKTTAKKHILNERRGRTIVRLATGESVILPTAVPVL